MELTRLSTIYGYDFYMPRGIVKSQQREIEETGFYERGTSETIFRFVERGMRVMDCGSNCGYHALNLAKATGRSKSYYAKKAIEEYLEEREDYLLAISRLEDPTDEVISLDEIRRRLGLDPAF